MVTTVRMYPKSEENIRVSRLEGVNFVTHPSLPINLQASAEKGGFRDKTERCLHDDDSEIWRDASCVSEKSKLLTFCILGRNPV